MSSTMALKPAKCRRMDGELLTLLRAANPWLENPRAFPEAARHRIPSAFVPRDVSAAAEWSTPGRAHLVVGARQVGKSSVLWAWFRDNHRAPLFMNAEEPSVRSWCRSATLVASDLAGLVGADTPILIDEAQHLEEAGLFIKGLIDAGLPNPLFVTGSSAFDLESRTRESLAGRATRTIVHPFSLKEIAAIMHDAAPLLRESRLREAALRQMVVGGYPAAWLSERPEVELYRLMDAFVVRDASDRFHIAHVDAFRTLLRLVASQTGSLVNVSEWAGICGVARGTVDDYLTILADGHIVTLVQPFVGGRRAELTHRPKVFFRDPGVRNAALRQFQPFADRLDRGAALEGWVAAELAKVLSPLAPLDTLRYWRSRSGAEVDFLVERPAGLVAVEAKAAALRRPALSRSSRSFIDAYHPRRFVVVNLGLDHAERMNDTDVRWVLPEAFAGPHELLDGPD